MADQALIGKTYPAHSFQITAERSRNLADALHGEWSSASEAVSPTMAFVAARAAMREAVRDPELGLDIPGRIHGEQSFEFVRAFRVGEVVKCSAEVARITKKRGMTFVVLRVRIRDAAQQTVAVSESTMIVRDDD